MIGQTLLYSIDQALRVSVRHWHHLRYVSDGAIRGLKILSSDCSSWSASVRDFAFPDICPALQLGEELPLS
jgi:hypothetical protein